MELRGKGFVGKKKSEKPIYKGITFDSMDEKLFYCYLEELTIDEVVSHFTYQPPSFKLFQEVYLVDKMSFYETSRNKTLKTKDKRRQFLKSHKYTPDFKIYFRKENFQRFKMFLDLANIVYHVKEEGSFMIMIVDIKPCRFGMKNMDAIFSLNQKWVYEKYGIYVCKVDVEEWFKATCAPYIFHYQHKIKSKEFLHSGEFHKKLLNINFDAIPHV